MSIVGDKIITYRLLNNEQGIAFANKIRNKYDLISDEIVDDHIEIRIGMLVENDSEV